jgi:DNA-binding transcriptional ArsR family regulator
VKVLYRALADPTRRRIMDELAREDGLSLFEIYSRLLAEHGTTSTRQAISQHLAVLEQAGLVRSERVGRTKVHHLDTAPLRSIIERWPLSEQE